MSQKQKCPDCGVEIGMPHVNQCDIERCSQCGDQYISCDCEDHDPAKSIWIGEFPVQDGSDQPGFVIYDNGKPAPEKQPDPKVQPKEKPYKLPSDDTLSASCRRGLRTHFYEPIYRDGIDTGNWRVCRNTKFDDYRPSSEVPWEAVLPSMEAVAEWLDERSQKEVKQ